MAAWAATLAAVAFASLCFVRGFPTPIYDSFGYWFLADSLRLHGLAGWPAAYRTYGYPLFVALVTGFRGLPPEETRLLVFGAQLLAHLGGCWLVSRRIAAVFRSETAGRWAYALSALNPVLLLHTTELLSDLASAVLLQLAVAFSWRLPPPDASARKTNLQAFLSFVCAGAAVMVRPANALAVAALGTAWLLRAWRWRELRAAVLAAALAGLIPPFLPQMLINHRLSGSLNPLIPSSLYREQQLWGLTTLKYATLVIDGKSPGLTYVNPLYRGETTPGAFLLRHPAHALGTLALHAFALIDQDLPFTYIAQLRPWYRWPLAVVNFALLYLAALGLLLAAARLLRRRPVELDEGDFALVSTALVGAAYLAVYLPVAVESRFGIALEALMPPLLVAAIAWLARPRRERGRSRGLAIAVAPIFIGACMLLSAWLTTTQRNRFVETPGSSAPAAPAVKR